MHIWGLGVGSFVTASNAEFLGGMRELRGATIQSAGSFSLHTGSLWLDSVASSQGFGRGSIARVISGVETTGEQLVLRAAAQTALSNHQVAIFDFVGKLNVKTLDGNDIDPKDVVVVQPDSAEEGLKLVQFLAREGLVDLLVIESLGEALTGKASESFRTTKARSESATGAVRNLARDINTSNVALILADYRGQSRRDASVHRALDAVSDLRITVRPIGRAASPQRTLVEVATARFETPQRLSLDLNPDGGLSHAGELLDLALAENLVQRRGAHYSYEGVVLGQGRHGAKEGIRNRPELATHLTSSLLTSLGIDQVTEATRETSKPTETGRCLNAWFEGEEPILPLILDSPYLLCLNIGLSRTTDASASVPFTEPDFGNHEEIPLVISLFSADFQIAERNLLLVLPRTQESPTVSTTVVPKRPGTATLRVVVSLQRELEVLQKLSIEVLVAGVEAAVEVAR